MKRTAFLAFAAFAVSLAAYLPCVRFSYVPLDDYEYVVNNAFLRRGLTVGNVGWAFASQRYADNCEWHPVAWLSMMADVAVCGGAELSDEEWRRPDSRVAKALHLHNALLHSACAALLFLLMATACRGRVDGIWLLGLALLWAIHPLRTEVVCWISERKEIASVFWMLVALNFYIRGSAGGSRSRFPRVAYMASLAAFLLALLSKPVAVTLPVVLLAWDLIFGRKVRVLRLVPFALASLATCFMTLLSQHAALADGKSLGVGARMTAVFGAPVVYLWQTFYPADLAVLYPGNAGTDVPAIILGLVVLAVMAALCGRWLARRLRSPLRTATLLDIFVFGVAWVYVGLVPMLGIVKVGIEQHSDRYTYWVGCGAVFCIALVLAEKGRDWVAALTAWASKVDGRPFDWTPVRRFLMVALAAVLAGLAVMTRGRAEVWRTPLALFRDVLRNRCDFVLAEKFHNYVKMTGLGDPEEIEYWYRESVRRVPSIESNLCLARYLLSRPPVEAGLGDAENLYTEPKMLLEAVLATDPDHREAKELLGRIGKARGGAR